MNKLLDSILKDRVTTSIALVCVTAMIVLAVYTKQLNLAQILNFVFTGALGLAASDGGQSK